jgi:hypothetical protein
VATLDKFKPHMIEAVSITLLPVSAEIEVPMVAAGSVDTRIHLICFSEDGKVFTIFFLVPVFQRVLLARFPSLLPSPFPLLLSSFLPFSYILRYYRMSIYRATRTGSEVWPSLCPRRKADSCLLALAKTRESVFGR